MNLRASKLLPVGAVVALVIAGVAWLLRANVTSQREKIDFQKPTTNPIAGRDAQPQQSEMPGARAVTEVSRNEATLLNSAPVRVESLDLRAGMTRVEAFTNAGRETPAAAFQTLVWSAIKGEDDELAATLALTDAAREKAVAWRASLPGESQGKYARLEKLPGLFLTEEIVRKAAGAQVVGVDDNGADQVIVRVRTSTLDGRTNISKFPMVRSSSGWQVVVPDDMIKGMRKRANR